MSCGRSLVQSTLFPLLPPKKPHCWWLYLRSTLLIAWRQCCWIIFFFFFKKWLTIPWQWFPRLCCDRTGEHLDEARLIFFFFSFGNRSVKKVPIGLNLTSLEEVNTVWCDPERGAGCCGLQVRRRCCGGEEERSNHSDNIWCREEVNLVVKSPSERKQAEDHRHVSLSLSFSQSVMCLLSPPALSEPDWTWV